MYVHELRFNSSMVRLKPFCLTDISSRQDSFNSSMVRLKPYSVRAGTRSVSSFNSSMVRLKHYNACRDDAGDDAGDDDANFNIISGWC